MKLAILSRNRQLHSIQRLLKEAKKLKVECDVFNPLDCQIVIRKDTNMLFVRDKLAPEVDVILPRIGTSITDFGLAIVRQFEMLGVASVNGSEGIAKSRDKLHCLQVLSENGFEIPTTVLMRGSRWFKNALRNVHGTPSIIKLLQGTQGVGVMLVESASSAESVLDAMWGLGQDVMLQQFILESGGRDIRAFVIGNKVVASMRRQARDGEFRSNIHRGGEGVLVELPEEYKKVAIGAVKKVGLTVAGVDMLESLTGPKIVEINSSPGFEGIEAATGLNIAKMIVQHAVALGRQAKREKRDLVRKLAKRSSRKTRKKAQKRARRAANPRKKRSRR